MSGRSVSFPLLMGILSLIILIPILGCGTGDFADRVSEEQAEEAAEAGTPTSTSPGAAGQTGMDLQSDSKWGDAFPNFSGRSQECIRKNFTDAELSSVLEHPIAIEGETAQWQVTMFGCLELDAAIDLYVLGLAARAQRDGQDVTEKVKECWTEYLSDTSMSFGSLVEADLPENRAAAGESPNAFSYRLSICIEGDLADGGPDPRELSYGSVSVGGDHSCGVTTGGTIICWGGGALGDTFPPGGTFKLVSVGGGHGCGMGHDNSVECWGRNDHGQATEPSITTFLSLGTGEEHTCGIRSSGELECWGSNQNGQSDPPTGNLSEVSAGAQHNCAISSRGSMECWGSDSHGQASPLDGVFHRVSAGATHTCGVVADESILCWGDDSHGQASPPSGTFVSISAGGQHTCGLTTDGTVECWGSNSHGQATAPAGEFISVSAGRQHTCGVRTEGLLECWGDNADGQAPGSAGS